jgi:rod shape-determining protein MreD
MEHYVRSGLAILALLLLQTTFVPFLSISGFLPDLLLIWVVYIAVTRGQLEATVTGFAVGLLQDVIAIQFFGLTALAKTLAGFVGGYFFNENITEQTLGSYRFLLIIVLSSLFTMFFTMECSCRVFRTPYSRQRLNSVSLPASTRR